MSIIVKSIRSPTEEVKKKILADVEATMSLSIDIHIMKNGDVGLVVKCTDEAPSTFEEFKKLPANSMKLHAVKAELIGMINRYQPSQILTSVLSKNTEILRKMAEKAEAQAEAKVSSIN